MADEPYLTHLKPRKPLPAGADPIYHVQHAVSLLAQRFFGYDDDANTVIGRYAALRTGVIAEEGQDTAAKMAQVIEGLNRANGTVKPGMMDRLNAAIDEAFEPADPFTDLGRGSPPAPQGRRSR